MQKFTNFITSKTFMMGASFVGLYLLATGSSWAIFTYLTDTPSDDNTVKLTSEGKMGRVDQSLPKTEPCPLNGKLYTKGEKQIWEDRRPITASIENHADSRPQSGLSFADVVYEVVAEGGITRFLSVFYCGTANQDVKIAPIRSARVYLIDWATEYGKNPIFMHVGGANNICNQCPGGVKPVGNLAKEVNAFALLDKLGWRGAKGNAFDGGTNVGVPVVIRDKYRLGKESAWEHAVVGSTDEIVKEATKRGFEYKDSSGAAWDKTFIPWRFTDDKALSSPKVMDISFGFWSNKGDYDVKWTYNKEANAYLRSNGGTEHVDHETGKQLSAKNVLIQFVAEKGPVDKEGHMSYTTVGKGKMLLFQNGDVLEGTWEKTLNGRTKFFDESGKEIEFVRGLIWIEAVPAGNQIAY